LIYVSLMTKDVEIFFMYLLAICAPFENVCSVALLIYWWNYLFFRCSYQMDSWHTFSPISWAVFSLSEFFPLLCRSFLICCNHIWQFLIVPAYVCIFPVFL
jgi:hypothetical protein